LQQEYFMSQRFRFLRLITSGHPSRMTAALSLVSALLLFANPGLAEPDRSWFIDKHGQEHPGYAFRFTDKQKLGRAVKAQESRFESLMSKRGVVGSAIGWDEKGDPIIRIFGNGASMTDLPETIDGFAVRLESSGPVYALKYACREDNKNRAKQCPEKHDEAAPAAGSTNPTAKHRPVPNGVSVGHPNITAGTVGCIVTQGCHTLMLSNNHVIADSNMGFIGERILQPGPFDGGRDPYDQIGTLFDYVNITMSTSASNRVDAALALVDGSDFTNTTLSDGYGQPKSDWLVPQAGMNVMKSGRTTGYTEGVITGINAMVNVNYNSCCARFVGQVVIEGAGNPDFALGGDSGSLVVFRGGPDDRRPVALVFALADSGAVFANPIDDVVNQLDIDNFLGEF